MTGVPWPIGPFPFSLMANSSDSHPHLGLFSFALTDKAFGVASEAMESIDAHWDYE